MKANYKRIALAVVSLAMFTDCDKQLDLRPIGQLNEETYYQNERDFEAASLSPYSTLLNLYYSQDALGWYEGVVMPDDDVTIEQNTTGPHAFEEEFNWNSNNSDFEYLWEQSYKGISRANIIINQLTKAKQFAEESNKLRYDAEARFIRAYFYFLLTTQFGNVPITETPFTDVAQTRVGNSEPGQVWDLIIRDLQTAKQNLPPAYSGNSLGRATSGAATALLGKVYLYRAQWDKNPALYANAISEFNAVVNSGRYTLVPNYADNFSPDTENNAESLFEIQFSPGDWNPWLPSDFGADVNEALGSAGTARLILFRPACGPSGNDACAPGANQLGYGTIHVTNSLQREFEPNDPRIPETYYREGDDFNGTPYRAAWSITGATPAKYVRQEDLGDRNPANRSINNERVIRYADVLLMLAEAELLGNNNAARAAQLINQVRRRADPTGTILPDRPAAADQMFKWLMHERRVELSLEGHRYNDLVRWHRAGLINIPRDVNFGYGPANQGWSERNLIKPIPQRELDKNSNLRQNQAYGG